MSRAADNVALSRHAAESFATAWLEACSDAVLVTGHGRYPLAWNRRFADLWQLSPGSSVRSVWRQIRAQMQDKQALLIASRQPGCCTTVALSGNRWIEIRTAPFDLPSTEPQQIWFCRDVSEGTRRNQALNEAPALRHAEVAERRAAQAEARLVEAIETLPVGFILFDSDEKMVLANSQCRAIFPLTADLLRPGVAFETLLRRNLPDLYPDADSAEIEAYVAARLANFRAASETSELPLADGRWIRAHDRHTPSGDTVSLRIDITERRLHHRELADAALARTEREAQLRRIYANISGVVFQLRVDLPGESQFEYISDRVFEVFGKTPADVLRDSRLILGSCHVEDKERLQNSLRAAHRARVPWDCEFRILASNSVRWLRGTALPTESTGGTVLWDGVFIDITATKTAEADALDARRRLEDAIESLSEGFALYDAGGGLLLANSRLREIHAAIDPGFVFSPGSSFEAAMRSSIAASPIDDPEGFITLRLEDFHRGNGAWEVQLANGQWIQGTERRMRDGGVVAMRRDITLLKRREEQLQAAMSEAMTANKAKSEFLANMSHELRTPLNAIIGFSEMIEAETFGPVGNERYRGYVTDIHASGQHLLNIINTVLDLARVEAGKIVLNDGAVDIAALVEDCTSLMRERLTRGKLRVRPEIEPGLPMVRADPVRLKQIVLNLLSNAIKFTEPGGDIAIRAGRNASGGLMLAISDTGIGMDPGHIAQAFEPFGLVHAAHSRPYEGTGLGLPLSRALVEEHGGQLLLTSLPGVGTTATVTLPAVRFIPTDTERGTPSS
ncbi:MAG: hypothetical protein QOJ54_1357 [Aliidongia sp.]|nr:hypothetical protein [Aliidongia sp.]